MNDDESFLMIVSTNSPIVRISSNSTKEDSLPPKVGEALQVYTRRSTSSVQAPAGAPIRDPFVVHTHGGSTIPYDIDLPITPRKRTRKYARNPLSKFVSYAHIYAPYHVFLSFIDFYY